MRLVFIIRLKDPTESWEWEAAQDRLPVWMMLGLVPSVGPSIGFSPSRWSAHP